MLSILLEIYDLFYCNGYVSPTFRKTHLKVPTENFATVNTVSKMLARVDQNSRGGQVRSRGGHLHVGQHGVVAGHLGEVGL